MVWGVHQKATALLISLFLVCFLLWLAAGWGTPVADALGFVIQWGWLWSLPAYYLTVWYLNRRHRAMVKAKGWRCPKREYLLEGLPARGTCPECSHEYDVATSLKDARAELEGVRDVRT